MQVLPLTFLPGESSGMMARELPVPGADFLALLQAMGNFDPESGAMAPTLPAEAGGAGSDGLPVPRPAGDGTDRGVMGGRTAGVPDHGGDDGNRGVSAAGAVAGLPVAESPVPDMILVPRMVAGIGAGLDTAPETAVATRVTTGTDGLSPASQAASGMTARVPDAVADTTRGAGLRAVPEVAATMRVTPGTGGTYPVMKAAPGVTAQVPDAAGQVGAATPPPDAGAMTPEGGILRHDRAGGAADAGAMPDAGGTTDLRMTAGSPPVTGDSLPRAATGGRADASPFSVPLRGAGDPALPHDGDRPPSPDGRGAQSRWGVALTGDAPAGAAPARDAPLRGVPVADISAVPPAPVAGVARQATGHRAGDDARPFAEGTTMRAPAGGVPPPAAPPVTGGVDAAPVGSADRQAQPPPDAKAVVLPAPQAGLPPAPDHIAAPPDRSRPDDGPPLATTADNLATVRMADVAGIVSAAPLAYRDLLPAVQGPAPGAPMAPHTAVGPPDAMQQTRLAVRSLAPGVTEIRLDPPELGALRLDLHTRGVVAHLRIAAEQAQVLDLVRGSIHMLAADLRSLGFERVEIALDGTLRAGADGSTRADGGAGQHPDDSPRPPPVNPAQGDPLPDDPQPRRVRAGASLDLRL